MDGAIRESSTEATTTHICVSTRKPWMNGKIEGFNGDFGEKLWEREQWTDLEHIRGEAKIFLMRHNNRQDWKHQKTDLGAVMDRNLPKDFEIDVQTLLGSCSFDKLVAGSQEWVPLA